MGRVWEWVREYALPPRPIDFDADLPAATFTSTPIADLIAAVWSTDPYSATVTRTEALTVPAVKRGRDIVCSVATLPLVMRDPAQRVQPSPLLRQLDPDLPNITLLTRTVEDLLFEADAWWLITATDEAGWPAAVRHIDYDTVSVDEDRKEVRIDGKVVGWDRLIRFPSPTRPLLETAGAVRRSILLDRAAATYAQDPRPADYFTPTDGADPADDDAVKELLNDWRTARRERATAYVPAALKYNSVDTPSPMELQLVELQRQAVLDVANAIGVDSEDLGVSTTSRTYFNATDRVQQRLNNTLAPFIQVIGQRLSMEDVTLPGYVVEFDVSGYLRADPKTQAEIDEIRLRIGTTTVEEIRERDRMPAIAAKPAPLRVEAHLGRPAALEMSTETAFIDTPVQTFAVDMATREVTGLLVPYGKVATRNGRRWRFAQGSLRWTDISRVKLLRDHDRSQAVGKAIRIEETPEGPVGTFRIARGPAGDSVLNLAEDGVLDGLSVGVDFTDGDVGPDPLNRGVTLVKRADLLETSMTAMPAFTDSRLTRIAATADEGETVPETEPHTEPAASPAPQTFTAEQLSALINGLQSPPPTAQPEQRRVVDPTGTGLTLVNEPAPYRFDSDRNLIAGTHDFAVDMVRGLNPAFADIGARQRAETFIAEQFATVTTDVNELNPTINQNRFIDQREYRSPVWDRINKGAPPNGVQPFSWPSFSSASGLVGAHTEGTEPTAGTYVTTNQTVTPTATSGKAKISRETWDMGGTPGTGNLIWRQMVRGYVEALEAKAITLLDGVTPTGITLTTGGGTTGQTLSAELIAAFARLHFVRGGFSMDSMFAQIDLYLALVGARDGNGRPLFPALGATNANGTVAQRFGAVEVNGVVAYPSWALAATGIVAASSYLFDSLAVDGWATPPRQLMMPEIEVANVYIGIWGYAATAVNDINGVREVIYDPA